MKDKWWSHKSKQAKDNKSERDKKAAELHFELDVVFGERLSVCKVAWLRSCLQKKKKTRLCEEEDDK